MHRFLAQIVLVLMVAMAPAHAQDEKVPYQSSSPDPEDLEVIAIMEILKLMDLAKEMEMVKDMEHLVEENKNERAKD